MKIGVIGLGLMGGSIVQHIAKSVEDLLVFDISAETRKRFAEIAQTAESIEEVFAYAEVVILSLPGSPEVESTIDVLLASGDVSGKAVIDLSTSYPLSSQKIHAAIQEKGGIFLDASLTGNPARALEGKLHAIVGGNEEDYKKLLPVFELFTEKTFYAGGPGTGNLLKLGTNYLAILYINLYSEIFSLIEKNGGDLQVFYEVISNSVVGCGMLERIAPKIMHDDYEVTFQLRHAVKDLTYAKQLGIDGKVPTLMLDSGLSQFLTARAEGLSEKDVSEVARILKKWILN